MAASKKLNVKNTLIILIVILLLIPSVLASIFLIKNIFQTEYSQSTNKNLVPTGELSEVKGFIHNFEVIQNSTSNKVEFDNNAEIWCSSGNQDLPEPSHILSIRLGLFNFTEDKDNEDFNNNFIEDNMEIQISLNALKEKDEYELPSTEKREQGVFFGLPLVVIEVGDNTYNSNNENSKGWFKINKFEGCDIGDEVEFSINSHLEQSRQFVDLDKDKGVNIKGGFKGLVNSTQEESGP